MGIGFENPRFNGTGVTTGDPGDLAAFPLLVRCRGLGMCTSEYQVPVGAILERIGRGDHFAEVARSFGISPEAVIEAVRYSARPGA